VRSDYSSSVASFGYPASKEFTMKRYLSLLFTLLLAIPLTAFAQRGDTGAGASATAPSPAEAKQFDFLLGQWELQVHPKVSSLVAMIHGAPKLVGTWKAWRVLDGLGVEDEMRIVDASGNPISLNRALRIYAKADERWKVSGVDAYRGHVSDSSGRLQNGEIRLEGHSIDQEGKPMATRTRYYEITPDSFRMQQDRSADNGQTWDEGVVTIEAKRTAASATP
jgi:hypothetical protein